MQPPLYQAVHRIRLNMISRQRSSTGYESFQFIPVNYHRYSRRNKTLEAMDGIRKLAHRGFPIPKTGSYSVRKYPDLARIQIRIDASGSTITEFPEESSQSYINRL